MVKKNILLIVLDSVTNDVLFNSNCSKKKAPFLYDLRNNSISGNKMYSEAPYTEAALKSLLGSIDTMDNGGYMEKFKNTYLVTEEFQKNGYKVFSNAFYPNIYPTYSLKGVDEKKYFEGFNFSAVWEYRFQYFREYYLEGKTSARENTMLMDMLKDNMENWLLYLKKIKNNDLETSLMNACVNRKNIDTDIKGLSQELEKFNQNNEIYFKDFIKKGENHLLFNISNYKYEDKINNNNYRQYFIKKTKKTLKKVKLLNFIYNFKNNHLSVKKVCFLLKKKNYKDLKGLLAAYKNSLFDKDLYDRCKYKFDLFKAQRSFKFLSKEYFKWLENNKDETWFSYLHVDDAHYPESFLSYDIDDQNNLNEELKEINKYINNLPKNYKGSLASDLSLLYCDGVIKNIYNYLKELNILEKTCIIITSDHGYSYSFCPMREKYVLTNYKENYNVPFIVYNGKNCGVIYEFRTTKDIPATLLDLANIKKPKSFKGISLLKESKLDYVTIEYMGGGCPDIIRRPINLGVRTNNYLVVMNVYLYKKFSDSIINEVYDLINDKYEMFNIYDKIEKSKISKELNIIENRYKELRREYL